MTIIARRIFMTANQQRAGACRRQLSTSCRRQSQASVPPQQQTQPAFVEKPVYGSTGEVQKMHGSYHWEFERLLSVALVPLCTVPLFTGPSRTADFLLAFILPLHCHLGFGQIVTDYLNPRKIGRLGNKLVMAGLYGATALSIYGLYQFNTKDVGITEFVRNIWTAPSSTSQDKEKKQ